jgi:hypothetical protein
VHFNHSCCIKACHGHHAAHPEGKPHPATHAALMVHALSRAVFGPCKVAFVQRASSAVECACLHFTHASSKLVVGTMGSTQKEIAKRSCFHGTGAAPDMEAETAVAPSPHARAKTDIVFGKFREKFRCFVLTFQLVNQMFAGEGWRKSFWDCRVSNRLRRGALITAAHQNCTIRSLSVELNVANLTREKKNVK